MKNILNYPAGTQIIGKEINEWCLTHQDLHVARVLLKKKYNNDRIYRVVKISRDSNNSNSYIITAFERVDKDA